MRGVAVLTITGVLVPAGGVCVSDWADPSGGGGDFGAVSADPAVYSVLLSLSLWG